MKLNHTAAGVLDVAWLGSGREDGTPVLLLHGFPYDVHTYDEVAPILAGAGCRVIVPWLRGYGPTRYLSDSTPRSGEQAALGADVIALMDALGIERAVLAGYDWGGRGACVASALWPERVLGLVTGGGYNIQNIAASAKPALPEVELKLWYHYYFHGERGRAGLTAYRREFCKQLWRLWSPTWAFDDVAYERTAASFDNPDFVDVVIHSYRHRFALVAGDPAYAAIEARLAAQPVISVPTVALDGEDSGIATAKSTASRAKFTGPWESVSIKGAGHNLPQEAPQAFAGAVLKLCPAAPASP
ncbi:alpha/beta hydrolase [soil metagenome]